MAEKKDRLNETRLNNNGEEMRIIRYGGALDIDVQFEDGTIVEHRIYDAFLKGNIRNPMSPSVYGVGFIGTGKFKSNDENGKLTGEELYVDGDAPNVSFDLSEYP